MNNNIAIERVEKNGISIFYLKGSLDFLQSVKVRTYMLKEIEEKHITNIIINLSEVHYMDSSGLGALVGVVTKVKKTGEIRMCNIQKSPLDLLKLTRLLSLFKIDATEDDSIRALQTSSKPVNS